jgi:hypothetical protein
MGSLHVTRGGLRFIVQEYSLVVSLVVVLEEAMSSHMYVDRLHTPKSVNLTDLKHRVGCF